MLNLNSNVNVNALLYVSMKSSNSFNFPFSNNSRCFSTFEQKFLDSSPCLTGTTWSPLRPGCTIFGVEKVFIKLY